MLISEESGKAENLGKTFRSKDENQQQTQPTNEAESDWWEASALTNGPSLLPKWWHWIFYSLNCCRSHLRLELKFKVTHCTGAKEKLLHSHRLGKNSFSDCDQACSFHLFRHTEWGPRSNSTTSVAILQRWRSIGNLPPSSTPSPWVGGGNRQSSTWWGPATRSRTLPVFSQFVTREFSYSAFVNFRHNSPRAEATKGSCLQVWWGIWSGTMDYQ